MDTVKEKFISYFLKNKLIDSAVLNRVTEKYTSV